MIEKKINVLVYKGDKGDIGPSGKDGITPSIVIKNVVESEVPYVKNIGTDLDLQLEIGLPRGKDGIDGKNGLNGLDGLHGKDGKNGIDGKNGLDATVKPIVVGSVSEGDSADVTIEETAKQYVLNFILPKANKTLNSGGGASKLSQLRDVKVQGIKVGETIVWDGVNFIPGVATGTSGSSGSVDLTPYALTTDVAGISSNLQGQIDAIVQEGTVIVGGPNITASQNGMVWTIGVTGSFGDASLRSEVSSISGTFDTRITTLENNPIPDIFRIEVAAISAGLDDLIISEIHNEALIRSTQDTFIQSQLNAITGSYTLLTTTSGISAGLNSRLSNVESRPIADIFRTEVASISAGLNNQISNVNTVVNQHQTTLSVLCSISGSAGSGSSGATILSGEVQLVSSQNTYTVTHASISGSSYPIVSLVVPNANSGLSIQGIYNISNTGFSVVLGGFPDNNNYKINWQRANSGGISSGSVSTDVGPYVGMFARTDSGQSISNSARTDVVFNTEAFDTSNAYNNSTGVFIAPMSGYYSVDTQVTYPSLNTTWPSQLFIYVNGNEYTAGYSYSGNTGIHSHNLHADVFCVSGDQINVKAFIGASSPQTLRAILYDNYLGIRRIK